MAKERKKREKRKSSVDLSRAIELGTEFSSEGARRYSLGKKIHTEAESLEEEIGTEQEKAEHKSLWSSVGLALGSLAAGIATGGANWYVQAAAVGLGALGGGVVGREASEFTKGEMKDIKSKDYLFYRKEADKQKEAYAGFDDELRTSIISRSLAAGALAGAVAGGGEILSKMKTAKQAKVAEFAKFKAQKSAEFISDPGFSISPVSAKTPTAVDGFPKLPTEKSLLVEGGASKAGLQSIKIDPSKMMGGQITEQKLSEKLSEGVFGKPSLEAEAFAELRIMQPPSKSLADLGKLSLTPMTDAAAPTIMDSFFQGIDAMKAESTRKSILLGGGYQIAGYRPELSTLRNIQLQSPIRSTYST